MKIRLEFEHDGQIARVVLGAPKGNIVDQAMMAELKQIFGEVAHRQDVKAVVLSGEGAAISASARVCRNTCLIKSVETLGALHGLMRQIADTPAPTIAAVCGRCLGGGLELALACDLIVAEETALLGCPEIQLGVFRACSVRVVAASHWTGGCTRSCY